MYCLQRVFLWGLVFFFFTVSAAQAHHKRDHKAYMRGEIGYATNPLCDTADQVKSIISAQIEGGWEKGLAKFRELNAIPSPRGGSLCDVLPASGREGFWKLIFIERVYVFHNVPTSEERTVTIYAHRVEGVANERPNGQVYYLLSLWDIEEPGTFL
jgi:hypothetical protein